MGGIAQTKIYRYFPIDSDKDITGDLIELSLDNVNFFTATLNAPSAAVQAAVAKANPPQLNLTRFWARIMMGPAESLKPVYGNNKVHGRITDNPEVPRLVWDLFVPPD